MLRDALVDVTEPAVLLKDLFVERTVEDALARIHDHLAR